MKKYFRLYRLTELTFCRWSGEFGGNVTHSTIVKGHTLFTDHQNSAGTTDYR